MHTWFENFALLLVLAAVSACAGCGAAETQEAVGGKSHAGWYLQHEGQGMFQPCGQERRLRITDSADLGDRARKFGLQPDTPVYVRLRGTLSASSDALAVSRVEQFGSERPVRDCGMTGVVLPAPSTAGD